MSEDKGSEIREAPPGQGAEGGDKGDRGAPAEARGEKKGEGGVESAQPLPPIDFTTFILSLSTSALMNLGEIPNPVTGKKQKELAAAKQTIDILGIIKDKTRGNLTEEEKTLVENVLTDLRLRYVRASGSSGG